MTPLQELAQQVLTVLDAQQAYFKCNASNAEEKGRLLNERKRLERELRARCEGLLDTARTPSLFDMEEAGKHGR